MLKAMSVALDCLVDEVADSTMLCYITETMVAPYFLRCIDQRGKIFEGPVLLHRKNLTFCRLEYSSDQLRSAQITRAAPSLAACNC